MKIAELVDMITHDRIRMKRHDEFDDGLNNILLMLYRIMGEKSMSVNINNEYLIKYVETKQIAFYSALEHVLNIIDEHDTE